MSVATCARQLTGLKWKQVLWKLPFAVALQLDVLYWQREGRIYKTSNKKSILAELEKADAASKNGERG